MKRSDKAYKPGAYGEVKDAPMFVCWREWDGEIRLGGVAKMLSTLFLGDGVAEAEAYFAVEIQGPSGCANHEQLLFGVGTTNIVIHENYTGTIEIAGKRLTMDQLHKLCP